jgi:O-methyltransferase involved in polyketide biosynthesis
MDRAGATARGGFAPARPSAWLIEGLFPYLDEPSTRAVLAQATRLAAPGARLAADVIGRSFLESQWNRPYLEALARENVPWRFGTDEPEAFWAAQGWDATVRRPGEEGASFGRWPYPVLLRRTAGIPNTYLVTASRSL